LAADPQGTQCLLPHISRHTRSLCVFRATHGSSTESEFEMWINLLIPIAYSSTVSHSSFFTLLLLSVSSLSLSLSLSLLRSPTCPPPPLTSHSPVSLSTLRDANIIPSTDTRSSASLSWELSIPADTVTQSWDRPVYNRSVNIYSKVKLSL
jgi:hypothetical protein